MADERFFAQLPALERFVEVPDLASYRPAPDSWALLITDVEGSTAAIEAGRYKDVNALGVASIVAVRNAVPDLELPFVFGGDGATMLCPRSRLDAIVPALQGLQARAREAFDLGMRAGIVPIDALRSEGHEVLVARYRASPHVTFAMLAGSGLTEGERRVKDPELGKGYAVEPGAGEADFRGFECRWEPIRSQRGSILSLLVQARAEDRRAAAPIYRRVIETIEGILGGDGCPVGPDRLRLGTTAQAFETEARLRAEGLSRPSIVLRCAKVMMQTRIGAALMARQKDALGFPGRTYKGEVVANTDFRKFDDTLRMVLDVTGAQRDAIAAFLEEERRAGDVVYGLHESSSALMTCLVKQRRGQHVHFVDGSDGGYALAAKQLKAQLRARRDARSEG